MACRLLRGERRDRDDPPAAAAVEVGKRERDEPNGGLQHQLDRVVDGFRRHFGAGARRRPARVPHEDVEPAEGGHRLLDGVLEIARNRHVTADAERADSLCLALEQLAPSPDERHIRALGCERLGSRQPEPRRRAGDERRPAAQPEVHVSGRSPARTTTRVPIPPRTLKLPSTSTNRGAPDATSSSSTSLTTSSCRIRRSRKPVR